jgi:hypothetical protein
MLGELLDMPSVSIIKKLDIEVAPLRLSAKLKAAKKY